MRYFLLIFGLLILLLCGEMYRELSNYLADFGGLQFNWETLSHYRIWTGMVAIGLACVGTSLFLFFRSNSN